MDNNRAITALIIAGLAVIVITSCITNSYPDIPRGSWLGQILPDRGVHLFAPGIVSTDLSERDAAWSPNGREFYFSIAERFHSAIAVIHRVGNRWTGPEMASFSGEYPDLEPAFSPDGSSLFFASRRPLPTDTTTQSGDWNLWQVNRQTDGNWSTPVPVITSAANEFYPCITISGTLYFTADLDRPDSQGREDIWMCRKDSANGQYMDPENIGTAVNSASDEFNAFIAPDESYILFSSWGREDGLGGGDLYVSLRDSTTGEWLPAKNLGAPWNSPGLDYCPFVTSDNQRLFITSRRLKPEATTHEKRSLDDWQSFLHAPQNGSDDVYWGRFKQMLKQFSHRKG